MNLQDMKKPIYYQSSEKRISPWLGLEPTKMINSCNALFFPSRIRRIIFKMPNGLNFRLLSEKLGDITRLYKIQLKCFDIIRRELWCYICMVLLVAWDSEHDTTTPRYRLIFTCQHTHPYYSCLIPLPPISNELLWKQKQINKKPMACLFSIKSVSVLQIMNLSYINLFMSFCTIFSYVILG